MPRLLLTSELNTYTRHIECPPDDVEVVHKLLSSVWADRPEVVDKDRFSFETAIVELTSNVIRHGDTGSGISCLITISVFDDRIEALLVDTGKIAKVDLTKAVMPHEFAESGRGIPLIKALVDTISYARDGDLNTWQFARKLTP